MTAKIGLNPDASRGLGLVSDSELLDGAGAPVTVFKEEEAALVLWPGGPNRPDPVTDGVTLPDVLET